jgi:serine protease Do
LRVKPDKPLPSVSFGDSDKLRIGNWVMVIGNPFGVGTSVSLGIVSARNRSINAGPYDDFIQTDAAINRGNSGGPLFNMAGEVVGINTAILSSGSGGSVGVGFSVPSSTAKSVINQLIKFGETRRGWLGVKLQPITPELDESMELKGLKGALVAEVTADSPSAKAGVLAGDVIVNFDGKTIKEMKELPKAVSETEVGKKVQVVVMRKGKEVQVTVELGRLEDAEKKIAAGGGSSSAPKDSVTALGLTASTLNAELRTKFKLDDKIKGAVITEVAKDSVAFDKRLEPGDVVIEAGSRQVVAASDITDAIAASEKDGKSSVLLLVAKGGKEGETRFIALKISKKP